MGDIRGIYTTQWQTMRPYLRTVGGAPASRDPFTVNILFGTSETEILRKIEVYVEDCEALEAVPRLCFAAESADGEGRKGRTFWKENVVLGKGCVVIWDEAMSLHDQDVLIASIIRTSRRYVKLTTTYGSSGMGFCRIARRCDGTFTGNRILFMVYGSNHYNVIPSAFAPQSLLLCPFFTERRTTLLSKIGRPACRLGWRCDPEQLGGPRTIVPVV
jgi:hypothetical protein